MKKLINLPRSFWIVFSVFVLIFVLFLLFLLNYKVEKTVIGKYGITGQGKFLDVPNSDAFKIHPGQSLSIKLGESNYGAKVSKAIKSAVAGYQRYSLNVVHPPNIPAGTLLHATIITDKVSIGSMVFGSV